MKNWKTTLLGGIVAIGLWLSTNTTGTLQHVGGIIAAVGAAVSGLVQKDNDVTGGTRQQ